MPQPNSRLIPRFIKDIKKALKSGKPEPVWNSRDRSVIKSKRQVKYAQKRLSALQSTLKKIRKKYASDKKKIALLSQGHKEHITQLKTKIAEFRKRLELGNDPVLKELWDNKKDAKYDSL